MTGFGFGVAGGKASNALKSNLDINTTGMTLVTNHVIGGIEGAVNQVIRPGGDLSIQNVGASAGLGFFNGADGPTVGLRRAR